MGAGSHHPAFGRRASASPAHAPAVAVAPAETAPPASRDVQCAGHDPELDDWKRARRWQPPWRQILLTASLCFGIASLVLPDTVNDAVNWLLYALTAASLYAGLRRRCM
ncbi:MAG TPA: hypothetical protein VHV26_16335 [Rhizomicrobium sp.]|jgi:hypothetical protein|nr:hypothetical protein [Rhizomicrobium sp.]